MARCPTRADGEEAPTWLVDRVSRLRPDLPVTTEVEPGGGQFLLVGDPRRPVSVANGHETGLLACSAVD